MELPIVNGKQMKKRVFLPVSAETGFTLIELLVVMTIIATLLTLAAPRYLGNVDKARESVLAENLATLRDVIDKHYADTGTYPGELQDLVSRRYIRKIPLDPFTDSNRTWIIVPSQDPEKAGIFDIHSGAKTRARDGSYYRDW